MNKKNLINKTMEILSEFCKNNTEPFFQSLDENAWVYGALRGKVVYSKKEIIKRYQQTPNMMTLVLKLKNTNCIPVVSDSCIVVLEYDLSVIGPNGFHEINNQRAVVTWANRKTINPDGSTATVPKIIVADFTNTITDGSKYEEANLFYREMDMKQSIFRQKYERLFFHGMQKQDYYFYADEIYYIASANEGHHGVVYTLQDKILCFERIAYFEQNYPLYFIRSHSSFLINPLFIQNVSRYECKLNNGEILPISKKRYPDFRKSLAEWHEKWSGLRENDL